MKRKLKITLTFLSMIMLFSCNYETYVINTVHKDGSVTRKVIMKNSEEKFEPEKYRVPVDSTWQTKIDMDINEAGDTSWILTAEKHFGNVDEINEEYINDQGSNQYLERKAYFSKSFKWFTTVFRYSETIDKFMTIACPVSDYLSDEELKFFYLPGNVRTELQNGNDSLKYEALSDTVELKSEVWIWTSFVRQWVEIFYDLFGDHPDLSIDKEEMSSKESAFVKQLIDYDKSEKEKDEEALQIMLNAEDEEVVDVPEEKTEQEVKDEEPDDIELIIISILGEKFYSTFKTEIDSAMSVLETMTEPFISVDNYDIEIRMPGNIIASNGYVNTDPDSENSSGILWLVKGEYFLTQQYEMWAESRVNNYWAWIISALFILFVITGFVIRSKKEKD
jgi:hypothetical protein